MARATGSISGVSAVKWNARSQIRRSRYPTDTARIGWNAADATERTAVLHQPVTPDECRG